MLQLFVYDCVSIWITIGFFFFFFFLIKNFFLKKYNISVIYSHQSDMSFLCFSEEIPRFICRNFQNKILCMLYVSYLHVFVSCTRFANVSAFFAFIYTHVWSAILCYKHPVLYDILFIHPEASIHWYSRKKLSEFSEECVH